MFFTRRTDEFEEVGLDHTLSNKYTDAMYWIDELSPNEGIAIGRRYGRVDRAKLREELLKRASDAGVRYMDGVVSGVDNESPERSVVAVDGGREVTAKLTALACGHNRELIEYEEGKPCSWQTAYGIEVRMPEHPFELDKAVFMDFRQSDPEIGDDADLWRVPSFLYVLPTDKDTVFLEETCLMSRVQARAALGRLCLSRRELRPHRHACAMPLVQVVHPSCERPGGPVHSLPELRAATRTRLAVRQPLGPGLSH